MSKPRDPVDTTCTSCAAAESIFMMEPLPNCFSIWARAACRALALASSMTFPSLTIGLSLILNVAADAGAAPPGRRNRNKKSAPCRPSHVSDRGVLRRLNARPRQRLTCRFIQFRGKSNPLRRIKGLRAQDGRRCRRNLGAQADRNPPRPESLLECFEAPGDRPSALLAPAVPGDPIVEDAVPVASDHRAAAARAVGRPALGVVDVARIHIAQTVP